MLRKVAIKLRTRRGTFQPFHCLNLSQRMWHHWLITQKSTDDDKSELSGMENYVLHEDRSIFWTCPPLFPAFTQPDQGYSLQCLLTTDQSEAASLHLDIKTVGWESAPVQPSHVSFWKLFLISYFSSYLFSFYAAEILFPLCDWLIFNSKQYPIAFYLTQIYQKDKQQKQQQQSFSILLLVSLTLS